MCSSTHKVSQGRTIEVYTFDPNCLPYCDNSIYRCLLTDLQSAEAFRPDHLKTPEVDTILDSSTHIYIEGFFLTHGVESATYVAKRASEAGKVHPFNPRPSPLRISSSHITH